jgi:hypothetical protein
MNQKANNFQLYHKKLIVKDKIHIKQNIFIVLKPLVIEK